MSWLSIGIAVLIALGLDGLGFRGLGFAVLVVVMGLMLQRLHERIGALEAQLADLHKNGRALPGGATAAPQPTASSKPNRPEEFEETDFPFEDEEPGEPSPPPKLSTAPISRPSSEPWRNTAPVPAAFAPMASLEVDERSLQVTSSIGESVLAWFRGGNAIVRIGAVILFIGVAFLLRFAAEHAVIPIEYRLAGVALGGLALVVVGWRLRISRRGYGLSLQGTGIGVLYLVIFAGLRLYALMPAPMAFGLLVILSLLTALLAMMQDALPLAVLAFGGGFLAPVFTSTGHGSHIALFSYYLALNAGIAWIASRKAWKLLNLVGFVFTFVIGTMWGIHSYEPALFASTETFLALHFALYLFISVQYSRQLAADKSGARLAYVDGGLLFGVPIVAFGLQAAIVRHIPYGLAVSSAALSGIYLLLGRWLWRHAGAQLRLLTEGLLALGLIFLVLVTPLALDARWTSAAWAIQGVGLLWIALRQQRGWAAAMGLLLQGAAALTFWSHSRDVTADVWLNTHLLGALILGVAAMWSAWLLRNVNTAGALPWPGAPSAAPPELIPALHWLMLSIGVLQALSGLWTEWSLLKAPEWDEAWRGSLLCATAALLLETLQPRLRWPELSLPARGLSVLAVITSALAIGSDMAQPEAIHLRFTHGWGWLEATAALGTAAWLQYRLSRDGCGSPWRRSTALEHLLAGWYVLFQGGTQSYAWIAHAVARHEAWTPLAAIVLPTLTAWWLAQRLQRPRWPGTAHPEGWRQGLLLPWLAMLGAWSLAVNLLCDGSMQPLPYLPLINPVDLGHLLALLYAVKLVRTNLLSATQPWALGAAGIGFVWLNGLLIRTLHHTAGTPMWLDGALANGVVQTGLTILWAGLALVTMLYATRRAAQDMARVLWLTGAGLLAIVVVKLFLIDLSSVGTLERIVSFLGVGLLMFVIGYVSPMPPSSKVEKDPS